MTQGRVLFFASLTQVDSCGVEAASCDCGRSGAALGGCRWAASAPAEVAHLVISSDSDLRTPPAGVVSSW